MMQTSESALEALRYAAKDQTSEICKAFAQIMEAAVNPFGFEDREFAVKVREDLSSREFFKMVCYAWLRIIEFLGKEDYRFDDRNKYAIGNTLMEEPLLNKHVHDVFPESDKWVERNIRTVPYRKARDMGPNEDPALYIATLLGGAHRTIFQHFSRLVFLFLLLEDALFEAQEKMGVDWWKC